MSKSSRIFKISGFTLIELLVVISIIALLMGILLPSLSRARKQAQKVVCESNMRQIGLAANMYAEAYNYLVPRGLIYNYSPTWFELFMPYLNQKSVNNDYRTLKIYRCGSYPNKKQTVCYVINGWKIKDPANPATDDQEGNPTKIISLKQTAKSIYLTDYEYLNETDTPIILEAGQQGIETCDIRSQDDLTYALDGKLNVKRRVPLDRHARGSNLLYFDWHVGHLESKKIIRELFMTH